MDSLKNHEQAIVTIETLRNNGFTLTPLIIDGEHRIKMTAMRDGIAPDDRELMRTVLLRNKPTVEAVTTNAEGIRDTLCNAQETLSKENREFLDSMDLWVRLEEAFRSVFPDDTSCINGEKGCPDDAIANCTACARGVKNGI